jgi:large subunit ribosomal protein L25
MSAGFELEIENRVNLGKGHSRRLRRQGKVPAVLYGGGQEPKAITLDQSKLRQQMEQEAFQTSILTLSLGKETQAVVVKDVQHHPAKRQVLHLDFQRILEDEKITLQVPIHYTGQEAAIGVREQGGEIAILIADVEISCLPKDLPEFLELDISELEMNQRKILSDVVAPEGVEILALTHNQDPAIITINPPRQEEEDEVPELEEDLELEGVEGEEPAEGEEGTPASDADEDGAEESKD